MFRRFRIFLGPERLQTLFLIFAVTGLGNLILNAVDELWATAAQNVLVLVFVASAIVIIGGRMTPYDRGRWAGLLLPAIIAVLIGLLLVPDFLLLTMGLAFGWIVAGLFIFRARGPMEYQEAVKAFRKNQYADAVKAMDGLIKEEPDHPNHYRFRAEILRVWGKLDRARRDYEKMTRLDPESAVAYNGLAEVNLQAGNYKSAQEAALKAYELAPNEWVAAYNLGMIEDRLHESEAAIDHLQHALSIKVPDARHRLLIWFYLARAYARIGDHEQAQNAIKQIKAHHGGLREWRTILDSPQAGTLRLVLEDDIEAVEKLASGELEVEGLSA